MTAGRALSKARVRLDNNPKAPASNIAVGREFPITRPVRHGWARAAEWAGGPRCSDAPSFELRSVAWGLDPFIQE